MGQHWLSSVLLSLNGFHIVVGLTSILFNKTKQKARSTFKSKSYYHGISVSKILMYKSQTIDYSFNAIHNPALFYSQILSCISLSNTPVPDDPLCMTQNYQSFLLPFFCLYNFLRKKCLFLFFPLIQILTITLKQVQNLHIPQSLYFINFYPHNLPNLFLS